jgi:protein phosphatase
VAIHLHWGAATDVGRVRSKNEDSNLVNDHLFAVADGMGGHRGGAVASQVAIESLDATFHEQSSDALVAAAYVANDAVFERASDDPELRGMGTTLVAIAPIDDDELLAWVHVGDSRIYLFRDGELQQLTEDHSLVEEWVREGTISAEEARSHPQRNILTRALGIGADVGIDAGTVIPYSGDRFVLCSDGLFNEVDEPRIEATLRRLEDPQEAAHELVRLALDGGGRDNITVVIVDVVDDDGAAMTASRAVRSGTVEGHAEKSSIGELDDAEDLTTTIAVAGAPQKETRKQRRARKKSHPRPRRITWRVLLFALLILLVLGGGAAAIGYQARHTYYVGFNGDSVVIFKGKPGGVLWFKPTVERDTGLTRAQVPAAELDRLNSGQEEGSVDSAEAYVQSIRDRTTTTTTSTTTTVPAGVPPTAPTTSTA